MSDTFDSSLNKDKDKTGIHRGHTLDFILSKNADKGCTTVAMSSTLEGSTIAMSDTRDSI